MKNYVSLHTHSDVSLNDGIATVDQLAEQAAKYNMEALALTDHGRCANLLQFKETCEKHNIKPIFGMEPYLAPRSRHLKERIEGTRPTYHITLLAKSTEGLRNLFRLSSIGWTEGFYYNPRIDIESLKKHREGLVALSGCLYGPISQLFLDQDYGGDQPMNEAHRYIDELLDIFGDDFYIEIQDHGLEAQRALNNALFMAARQKSVPLVTTNDIHFIKRSDAELYKAVVRIGSSIDTEATQIYFKSYKELKDAFGKYGPKYQQAGLDGLANTLEIAKKCNVSWEYGKTIWPVYDLPKDETPEQRLREKIREGFKRLFGKGTEEYIERIKHELEVIERMGFATYFLIVADFINWAKNQGIPTGAGRGSVAGSLVAYCLGITQVDPIRYGLYFSRFLNSSRVSLPDIDTDICFRRRKEVIEYLANKYGKDKVAQIGTFSVFKPRGSLRDFARACGYDMNVQNKLANMIPPDIAGKALTFEKAIETEPQLKNTDYPEVVELARAAEGLKTRAGVHAAGVVVSDRPVTDHVPLYLGKHDEVATQFDMKDVEKIGLVKLDLLGLVNLTIIQDTIDIIKEIRGDKIDISTIPDDDQNVFTGIFQKGDLDGVFQFENSSGFRDLCVQIKPVSIEDLALISALFRPGPLDSGLVSEYAKRRAGASFEYPIPELEPVLESTYGITVYQEQIMRICTDLAGYTAPEADTMRKVIGKKQPDEMVKQEKKFINGCTKNGIDKKAASDLFRSIENWSLYGFNKSHAIAYSVTSYRTAWLKYYYPEEFYTALFNSTMVKKTQDKLVKYIHSCKDREIPVMPPDINRSQALFSVDQGTILFGLAGVKGIGEKACKTILDKRPRDGYSSLDSVVIAGINQGVIRSLVECGALEDITDLDRKQIIEMLPALIGHYRKVKRWEERKERFEQRNKEIAEAIEAGKKPLRRLPALPPKPEPPEIEESEPLSKEEKLSMEKQTLGFYVSGHPMDAYPQLIEIMPHNIEWLRQEAISGSEARLPVVVYSIKEIRTRKQKNMATAIIEDKTGRIEAVMFPKVWKKLKPIIEEDMPAVFHGRVEVQQIEDEASVVRLIVLNVIPIVEDHNTELGDLKINLQDGSVITFIPDQKMNRSEWQKAAAMAHNIGEIYGPLER